MNSLYFFRKNLYFNTYGRLKVDRIGGMEHRKVLEMFGGRHVHFGEVGEMAFARTDRGDVVVCSDRSIRTVAHQNFGGSYSKLGKHGIYRSYRYCCGMVGCADGFEQHCGGSACTYGDDQVG